MDGIEYILLVIVCKFVVKVISNVIKGIRFFMVIGWIKISFFFNRDMFVLISGISV